MIIAIVFAHVWGVIQLIVLGSLARTVRVRTVLTALVAGLYACALLATLLQLAWTQPAAWLTGMSVGDLVVIGGYSVDPYIEEIVKVLPVVVLLTVPVIRRQWSITDCVLVAAAAGSGLGLAEALYRHGDSAGHALAESAGWTLATNISYPFVPSVWTTLSSWLPPGVESAAVFQGTASGRPWVNLHLAWSAIGGLAVGLIRLRPGRAGPVVGPLLLLYIGADHAAYNAGISYTGDWLSTALAWVPFGGIRAHVGLMPIAALAVAWWIDRSRQQEPEPLLAAERSASPRILGTLRAAVSHVPWSLPSVYGFVRMRRAYNSTRASGSDEDTDRLHAVVVEARDRLDQQLVQLKSPPGIPSLRTPGAVLAVVRRPAVILWLVLMTPSVLWFVVGGWPQTAGIQRAMTSPGAWPVVLVLSVAAQSWVVWRAVAGVRSWPEALRLPVGDETAILGLRIACGIGAVGLGGYALMRGFSGVSPTQGLFGHTQDAAAGLNSASGLQLANGAAMDLPPGFFSEPGGEGAGAPSATLPPGFAAEDNLVANPSGTNMATVPPSAAASALPPNPYADVPSESTTAAEEKAAQSAFADAATDYAAAHMSGNTVDEATEAALATKVAAAAAASDLAAGHSTYDDDYAAARAADAAARTADPFATPHGVREMQNEAQLIADELRAKVAAADAAAENAAAHAAYRNDYNAASAADAAAKAADPSSTPHEADDVLARGRATHKDLAAKVAAANAAVDLATEHSAYEHAYAAARAADAAARAADPNTAPHAAADLNKAEQVRADDLRAKVAAADAAARDAADARAAYEKAYEDKWKRLKG